MAPPSRRRGLFPPPPGNRTIRPADITPTFVNNGKPFRLPQPDGDRRQNGADSPRPDRLHRRWHDHAGHPGRSQHDPAQRHRQPEHHLHRPISTSPAAPLFGGGTDDIAFLLGDPTGAATPNANATQMSAVFWIETVQYELEVPVFPYGNPPRTIPAPTGEAGQPVPRFLLDPPHEITEPRRITVTTTQIQYSQRVLRSSWVGLAARLGGHAGAGRTHPDPALRLGITLGLLRSASPGAADRPAATHGTGSPQTPPPVAGRYPDPYAAADYAKRAASWAIGISTKKNSDHDAVCAGSSR